MTGKLHGAINRIENVTINSSSNNCIPHRYTLVTKRTNIL